VLQVFGQPSVKVEPSKGALNDPALWQNVERLDAVEPFDHFQHLSEHGQGPPNHAFFISAINEYFQQIRKLTKQACQHNAAPAAFRKMGCVHDYRQQTTQRVHRYMALAALDLLATVIAALPPF